MCSMSRNSTTVANFKFFLDTIWMSSDSQLRLSFKSFANVSKYLGVLTYLLRNASSYCDSDVASKRRVQPECKLCMYLH